MDLEDYNLHRVFKWQNKEEVGGPLGQQESSFPRVLWEVLVHLGLLTYITITPRDLN